MLRQYRQEFDEKRKVFRDHPRHDYTSHSADAFRYLAVGMENKQNMVKAPQSVAMTEYDPFSI